MPEITAKPTWSVEIVEYERGWGSKVDEIKYFDIEKDADDYVRDYNTKYNPPLPKGTPVPDWYMIARGPYRKL